MSSFLALFVTPLLLLSWLRCWTLCYSFESTTINRVCMIDDYDNALYNREAQMIAQSLSIPLTSEIDFDVDENEDETDSEQHFTHALSMVEYNYGGISSYAVAIDTIDNNSNVVTGKNSKKTKHKQSKRIIRQSKKPFYIDLFPSRKNGSRIGKRSHGASGQPDLLVKAVAPQKRGSTTSDDGAIILDATAGFGSDSLILAMSGASHVYMVERDPIVSCLLNDAIRRLNLLASPSSADLLDKHDAELAVSLSERLTLIIDNGKNVALKMSKNNNELDGNSQQRPDVVYLDPMFPPRKKSAAVKKNMQILHGLLQTQQQQKQTDDQSLLEEEYELLEASICAAKSRVIVKRPIGASPLGDGVVNDASSFRQPSYSVCGSVNRWDVYLK